MNDSCSGLSCRVKVGAAAIAVALLLHLHYFLMWYERDFYRKNHPAIHDAWANDGGFTVLGVYSAEWDNPTHQAARVREAGERWLPYDPYIKEIKSNRLLMTDPAYFMSFGLVQRLTGNIHVAWHVARFLMCVIWVILLYVIFRRAKLDGPPALFWAAAVTLFFELILNLWPNNPVAMLKNTVKGAFWIFGNEMQWFGPMRTVQPLFAFAVFLAAGVWIVKLAKGEGGWGTVAVSGVLGALVTNSHADVFVTYFAAAPILVAGLWAVDKKLNRRLVMAIALSAALSLPTVLMTRRTLDEWAIILHSIGGREVNWPSFLYLAIGSFAVWRLKDDRDTGWWGSVLIGIFLLSNMQLITGITIEPYHYRWIGNFAAIMMLICAFGGRWPSRAVFRWALVAVSLIAVTRAVSYAAQHYRSYAIPKDTQDGLAWLNANSERGSVVGSLSFEVTVLTPVYSHNHTLVCRNSMLVSDVTHQENADRFAFLCRLLAIPPETLVPVLTRTMPASVISAVFEGDDAKIRETREDYNGLNHFFIGTQHEHISGIIERTLSGPDGRTFDVQYLWVGPLEKRRGVPADFPASSPYRLEPAYQNGSVTIYRVLGPKN